LLGGVSMAASIGVCASLAPESSCSSGGTCSLINGSYDNGITWSMISYCDCPSHYDGNADFISKQFTLTVNNINHGYGSPLYTQQTFNSDCQRHAVLVNGMYMTLLIAAIAATTTMIVVLVDGLRRYARVLTTKNNGIYLSPLSYTVISSIFRVQPMPLRPAFIWLFQLPFLILVSIMHIWYDLTIGHDLQTTLFYVAILLFTVIGGVDYLYSWAKVGVAITRLGGPEAAALLFRCRVLIWSGVIMTILTAPLPIFSVVYPKYQEEFTSTHYGILGASTMPVAIMLLYYIKVCYVAVLLLEWIRCISCILINSFVGIE
jgi:hypothetical protein